MCRLREQCVAPAQESCPAFGQGGQQRSAEAPAGRLGIVRVQGRLSPQVTPTSLHPGSLLPFCSAHGTHIHRWRPLPESQCDPCTIQGRPSQDTAHVTCQNRLKLGAPSDAATLSTRELAYRCGMRACRLTQRWEASLWLAGKQMYLGGFQDEDDAARAYDLAALACKGLSVPTNFPVDSYTDSLTEIGGSSRVSPGCAARTHHHSHSGVDICPQTSRHTALDSHGSSVTPLAVLA